MQNFLVKIFTFLLLLISSVVLGEGTSIEKQMQIGNELFSKKQYSQALLGYEQLVKNERVVSELLLNKLIWLSIQVSDKDRELLYRSMLYRFFPTEKSKQKLTELNSEIGTELFYSNPQSWFFLWWSQKKTWVLLFVFIGLVISGVFSFLFWRKKSKSFKVPIVFSVMFSVLLLGFYLVPFMVSRPVSFISSGEEKFFKAPSYASERVDGESKKQEQLNVISDYGPWIELMSGEDTLYLPKNDKPFIF